MWDHQVAALSGAHRCLRPDAWGCGASPPPLKPFSIDTLARDVLDAVDAAGITRFPVAGLSMGGYLAMALLRIAPERITGLALLATRANADPPELRDRRTELIGRLRAMGQPAVDGLVETQVALLLSPVAAADFHISDPVRGRIRRCSAAGLAALAEMMRDRPDSTAALAQARVPVLVVAGTDDSVVPPDEMRALAAAIPGARYEEAPGCGHLVNLEDHSRVSALLGQWLECVEAT